MGYCTRYDLSIESADTTRKIIDKLRAENANASYALDINGDSNGGCKWYEHEKELREFSRNYPESLFKLSGAGEESGDIWTKYFLNGKCQDAKAKITVEPFDKKKLV